jgi:DNA-binding MarR family transcriptional regulator
LLQASKLIRCTRPVINTSDCMIGFKNLMNNKMITEHIPKTEYQTWMLFSLTRNSVYRLRELELAQFGLTVEQSTLLYLLIDRGGSANAKTIEYLTLRQHHSISTLVNRMIKMHLVTREKKPESKKFEILVTQYGDDLYKKVPTHSLEMLYGVLKEKDRERLYVYLNTLLARSRSLLGQLFAAPSLYENDVENNWRKDRKENNEAISPNCFELWMAFNRTRNSVYRLRELELAQFGLSVEQSAILYLLISQGGSTNAKAIEYLTMRQHHSISTLINRMTKMHLVTRKKRLDSKKYEILITKHGADLYKQLPVHSIEMIFSSLKSKDRERMYGNLETLLHRARDLQAMPLIPTFLLK